MLQTRLSSCPISSYINVSTPPSSLLVFSPQPLCTPEVSSLLLLLLLLLVSCCSFVIKWLNLVSTAWKAWQSLSRSCFTVLLLSAPEKEKKRVRNHLGFCYHIEHYSTFCISKKYKAHNL